MASGVTARLLHVDLTGRTTRVEELPETTVRKYLGGGALAAYVLLRELRPPLSSRLSSRRPGSQPQAGGNGDRPSSR